MQNKKENKETTEEEESEEPCKDFSDRFSEEQINDFLEAFHVFDKGNLQHIKTFIPNLF